jgi:uncharacterized protein (DUF58 family)
MLDANFHRRCEGLRRQAQRAWGRQFLGRRRRLRVAGGTEATGTTDYTTGDELRYVDWNRCARHDELVTRQFMGTEDHWVYFLLDCSRSMNVHVDAGGPPVSIRAASSDGDSKTNQPRRPEDTGEPPVSTKFELARELTAALGFLALANQDRVAVTAFADRVLAEFPTHRGRAAIPRLFEFLTNLDPTGEATRLEQVVESFVAEHVHRGLVVLVSDMLDAGRFDRAIDSLRLRGFEPLLVHVLDRGDIDAAFSGKVALADVEGGRRRDFLDAQDLSNYSVEVQHFLRRVHGYFHRYGLGVVQVNAGDDVTHCIQRIVLGSVARRHTRAGVRA